MDIFLKTNLETAKEVLKEAGFVLQNKGSYFSAERLLRTGKEHVHFKAIGSKVYLDLHFQHRLHFMFWRVSHKQLEFFNAHIKPILLRKGIVFETHFDTWFTRHNKALLWGMRT